MTWDHRTAVRIKASDGNPDIEVARTLIFPPGSVVDNGDESVSIAAGGGGGGPVAASAVSVADAQNLFAATNVEDALREVMLSGAGLSEKVAVRLASVTNLPANTYANGAAGVGATLTGNANGALQIDGVLVAAGNRVLVMNEGNAVNNGVYVVTATGSAGAPYVLTRATDGDEGSEVYNALYFVTAGAVNLGRAFFLNNASVPTVGTTVLAYAEYSYNTPGGKQVSAGAGLQKSGNVISALFGTTAGTVVQGNDPRFTTLPANPRAGNYTLQLSDAGQIVDITSATPVTVTIPANAAVAFPVNTVLQVHQGGAGAVTFAIQSDTLRAPNGTQIARQYAVVSLWKRSATEWVLSGDTLAPTLLSAITGLQTWLKPLAATMFSDNMTTPIAGANGNPVLGWQDQSGGNRHGYQASAGLAPLYRPALVNGLPMLEFNGTSQVLPLQSLASVFAGSDLPLSFLLVLKSNSLVGTQSPFGLAGNTATGAVHYTSVNGSTNYNTFRRDDAAASKSAPAGVPTLNLRILLVSFAGTTVNVFLDGTKIVNGVNLDVGTATFTNAVLGAMQADVLSQYFNGDIGEFAAWNKAISDAEAAQAYYYARSQWGV